MAKYLYRLTFYLHLTVLSNIYCYQFRFNDDYTCHCSSALNCHHDTGICSPPGCQAGWFGPSCQKENIALNGLKTQLTSPTNNAVRAADGDRSHGPQDRAKCTATYGYWTVDFHDIYPIREIMIYNREDDITSLQSFMLYTIVNGNGGKLIKTLCFQHNNQVLTTEYPVRCNSSGQHITIVARNGILRLCEVEVYVCSFGTYGPNCTEFCHCKKDRCDDVTGICPNKCLPGWRGGSCNQTCSTTSYGQDCALMCENRNCAGNSECDHVIGNCTSGCQPGWIQNDCTKTCSDGRYGDKCSKECSVRNCITNSATCDHEIGTCIRGCDAGWSPPDCIQECQTDTFYGVNCSSRCEDRKCSDLRSSCDPLNGECSTGCQNGWVEDDCTKECNTGFYGVNCSSSCENRNCFNETVTVCDNVNGKCDTKCKKGFMGDDCRQKCKEGFFDRNCEKECSARQCVNLEESSCDHVDGSCDSGCLDGYSGVSCSLKIKVPGETDNTVTIVAVVVSVVLLTVIVIIIFLYVRRRHRNPDQTRKREENKNANLTNVSPTQRHINKEENSNIYVNVEEVSKVENNVRYKPEEGEDDISLDVDIDNIAVHVPDEYYNTTTDDKMLNLEELKDFVIRTKEAKGFKHLFETLLTDVQASYDASQIPENRSKNRFRTYYPYDHTRVVLNKYPGDPYSDYINANYLDGDEKEKEYIAAQGATKVTLNDFIRMILELQIDKVLMLTNLHEMGKLKCEQYWPENDTQQFGKLTVILHEEKTRADFTIRLLTVTDGKVKHRFHHFHFTSWPDHDVPLVDDLLEFIYTVNKHKPNSTKPVLIHCSAGIGRTGTYITIDSLLNQAARTGKVNVIKFVNKMRTQRINMIQTAAQFQFVYEALIKGFQFGNTSLAIDVFEKEYASKRNNLTFGKLTQSDQFNLIAKSEVQSESGSKIFVSQLPVFAFPSRRRKLGYVLQELEGLDTVSLWTIILDQESSVVVVFLDKSNEVVICPEIGIEDSFNCFKLHSKTDLHISNDIDMITVSVVQTEYEIVRTVHVFIIRTEKTDGQDVSVITKNIIEISEQLDIHHTDNSIVSVFSSDPNHARLFCILRNIIQRIKLDNEVEVFNVVCKMHSRIGKTIESKEKYFLIHQFVSAYIKSTEVYANL